MVSIEVNKMAPSSHIRIIFPVSGYEGSAIFCVRVCMSRIPCLRQFLIRKLAVLAGRTNLQIPQHFLKELLRVFIPAINQRPEVSSPKAWQFPGWNGRQRNVCGGPPSIIIRMEISFRMVKASWISFIFLPPTTSGSIDKLTALPLTTLPPSHPRGASGC